MKFPLYALTVLLFSSVLSASPTSFTATDTAPSQWLTQQIHNATFLERTPEFTDLYIIQTPDKGRSITIYCNSAYCYKRMGETVMV